MLKGIQQLIKNHSVIIIMILGVVYAFLHLLDLGYIESFQRFDDSEHFSILSIASLFGGFIFTGLGIIISGISTERLARLNENGYMDRYYHEIYLALFCNIVTIVAAIILISCTELISTTILYWIAMVEQLMLYESIALFIKCMISLCRIVNKIRKA